MAKLRADLYLTAVKSGKFKDFAAAADYGAMCASVALVEDRREIKTIHKAKGAEFDGVLVDLNEELLNLLLGLRSGKEEEKRIGYVALSRARDALFLGTSTVTAVQRDKLTDFNIAIIDLTNLSTSPSAT